MPMSGARMAWVLGTYAASFLATVLTAGGDVGLMAWIAVIAAIPLVVGVHEVGHAVGAMLVGYRVRSIHLTACMDAVTEWDVPPGRESTARDMVAILAGPVAGMALSFGLLLMPWHGFAGGWAAGVGTFGFLLTLDSMAPIRREIGVDRDGFVLARLLDERRGERGDHGPEVNAVIAEVDEVLLAGDPVRARTQCSEALDAMEPDPPRPAWSALAARLAIADLLGEPQLRMLALGYPSFVEKEAEPWSAEAVRRSPRDPVVAAARRAVAARLGLEETPTASPRRPTPPEERLIALVTPYLVKSA